MCYVAEEKLRRENIMPKITNPVVRQKITESLLKGNSAKQAALDGGLSINSAINATKKQVVIDCKKKVDEIFSEEEFKDSVKRIIKRQLSVLEKLYVFLDSFEKISKSNFKIITTAINKNKDSIEIMRKMWRVEDDKPTEILDVKIREEKLNNMRNYFSVYGNSKC